MNTPTNKFISTLILGFLIFLECLGNTYYVSSQGNNMDPGSFALPFKSLIKAIEVSSAGDTIYMRGGTYYSAETIIIDKTGSSENHYLVKSYPGERAILDFFAQPNELSNDGLVLTGDYCFIEGLTIRGAGSNGLRIDSGNWNEVVNCSFSSNRSSGVLLSTGSSQNKIINCDSYHNSDSTGNGNGNGFAYSADIGTGNAFYNCRAWLNTDDGWKGIITNDQIVSTEIINCWSFQNGYYSDGSENERQDSGHGFKLGETDNLNLICDYTLINCLAFSNRKSGFNNSSNSGSLTMFHCTAHNNAGSNYFIDVTSEPGQDVTIKNSSVLGEEGSISNSVTEQTNSWMEQFIVTAEDFVSLDEELAKSPRMSDGGLPDMVYLQLSQTSDLVDAGVDVGLPYQGMAPDIGYTNQELGHLSGIQDKSIESAKTNIYPNPASDRITIAITSELQGAVTIIITDLAGRIHLTSQLGIKEYPTYAKELSLFTFGRGTYLYQIKINDDFVDNGKLMIY